MSMTTRMVPSIHERCTEKLALSSVRSPRREHGGLHDRIVLIEHAMHNRLHMDMTWGSQRSRLVAAV